MPPTTIRSDYNAAFYRRWAMAMLLSVGVVMLAALPPFVGPAERLFVMLGFSPVCHQIPERSPMLMGTAFAVCHRCFGFYSAIPLAGLSLIFLKNLHAPLWKYGRFVVPLALAPMAIDWALPVLHLGANTPASRMITGGVFGLSAGIYLMLAVAFRPKYDKSEATFDSESPSA